MATLVQSVAIANAVGNCNPLPIQISTTAGNTLLAWMGEDLSFNHTNAPMPSFTVSDSAGNIWMPAVMSTASQTAARGGLWICSNALPVNWVSVAANGYVTTFIGGVSEFSGMPAFPVFDFIPVSAISSATTLTLTGTATQADYIFSTLTAGSTALAFTVPTGLTAVTGTQFNGGSNPNGMAIQAAWGTASSGPVSYTWTISAATPMAGCLLAISQANFPPAAPVNPSFPSVKVEMAFGASPGDLTAAIMDNPVQAHSGWTDITPRAIGKAGQVVASGLRGRTYELSQPETGTLALGLRNDDGAFNPANTASPYYPNVVLNTPIRLTAVWSAPPVNLLQNPAFEDGLLTPWTGQNGATLRTVPYGGGYALAVTPNGSTAFPYAYSELDAATAGDSFSASAQCYSASAYASGVALRADFIASDGVTITGFVTGTTVALPGNAQVAVTLTGAVAPAGTVYVRLRLQVNSTPANTLITEWTQPVLWDATRTAPRRYALWSGFVTRWPQDWPDMPQYGMSKLQAVDIVGVASSVNLPSALQGEILADAPVACLPFSEQYTTTAQAPAASGQTQVGTVKVATECDGLLAINTSRTSQRTGTYQDGETTGAVLVPVQTGLTLGLLGDAGTGMGASAYAVPPTSPAFRGPGVVYSDPTTSVGAAGNGFTVEFIANVPTWSQTPAGSNLLDLLNVMGPPVIASSVIFGSVNQQTVQVYIINNASGVYTLWAGVGTYGGVSVYVNWPYTTLMGSSHVIALEVVSNSFTLYIDGVNVTSATGFSARTDPIAGWCFGAAQWPYTHDTYAGNYAMAYGTIYNYQVPPARLQQHATAALQGFQGETTLQRFGRYLAWTGLNLNPAAWPQTSAYPVLAGAAYQTANTPLSDALNQLTLTEGGTWFANCNGALMFAARQAQYNQPPSITFGDSSTPGAEVPYVPGMGLDYDNTYVSNVVQATQTNGPNTLIAPIEKDTVSQTAYFQRGPLQQAVSTTSAQDAYDRAYWSLNKYRQPSMRLRGLQVDAASNPAAFAPCLQTDVLAIATVNRRPIGAAAYSLPVSIQQVGFDIGPGVFTFKFIGSPYTPEGTVLTADTNDVLGNSVLAW